MPINFGSGGAGSNRKVSDCVKELINATGGDPSQLTKLITESIQGISVGGQIGGAVGGALDSFAGGVNAITSNLERYKEGLPLNDVIPSNKLRPPINVKKSATDIVGDLQSRCTDFVLAALDQLDPLERLEQLLDLVNDLCNQANFTDLRKVLDKVDQTQREIVSAAVETITDPLEKVAKLNDMLVDAINSGAQEAIKYVDQAIESLNYQQLYSYINALDPEEAIGRLQAEIKKRTQIGDFKGVQDMLNAVSVVEARVQQGIETVLNPLDEIQQTLRDVLPSIPELFDLPETVINEAQKKIDDALTLGNYQEIQNVVTAVDGVQNEVLSTLQELDPATLLQKGTTLLNEALEDADIGRYNRILDEMAKTLCTQDQLGVLPSLPNIPNVNLPGFIQ